MWHKMLKNHKLHLEFLILPDITGILGNKIIELYSKPLYELVGQFRWANELGHENR